MRKVIIHTFSASWLCVPAVVLEKWREIGRLWDPGLLGVSEEGKEGINIECTL